MAALGALALSLGFHPSHSQKTHILPFNFVNGLKKSFLKLAEIRDKCALKALLNVIVSGNFPDFKQDDDWIPPELTGQVTMMNGQMIRAINF